MIGEAQKKLRAWFRRHGWRTDTTPTGNGFHLETPVQNDAGLTKIFWEDGKKLEYCREIFASIELDRFNCDYVTFTLYARKHWWKPATDRFPEGWKGYSFVPSDDFSEWERKDGSWFSIPARDIIKLAELIKAAQADWMQGRKTKNHLNFMERIARH